MADNVWPQLDPRSHSRSVNGHRGPNMVLLLDICFVLLALGQVALNFLLGTLLYSTQVRRRNVTVINLLLVTELATIPPALLYYANEIWNPIPLKGLCLVQAVLKSGTDPMFIVASLALTIEVCTDGKVLFVRLLEYRMRLWLVVGPYAAFLVGSIWSAALAAEKTSMIKHNAGDVFCTVALKSFGITIWTLSVVVVVLTLSLELYAFYSTRHMWRSASRAGTTVSSQCTNFKGGFMRILLFTFLQLLYLSLVALDFHVESEVAHVIPVVYMASMPLATFCIFGSAADCIAVWKTWLFFWRSPSPAILATHHSPGLGNDFPGTPISGDTKTSFEFDFEWPVVGSH